MNSLTLFGACAVTAMLISYAQEKRSTCWILILAIACGASSLYGWLADTWPFGVVEGCVGASRIASLVGCALIARKRNNVS